MSSQVQTQPQEQTLFGHPTGLFTLFFAEMWERFSYYGMRALLVLYMIKGFLGFNDDNAYGVYGAYCGLVYAAPFIGGVLADRLLGPRRGVVLGGLLMAAGHLAMTVENETVFFLALALLICGNGFFKPNISTIVGTLYPKNSVKKDAGFTIFYMGINLGAAMSPVICGYVGETYGWHYGFGLATAGMLAGVAVFVAPTRLTQIMILSGAVATAVAMPFFQDTHLQLGVRLFLAVALVAAGLIAFMALGRGGLPQKAGRAPSEERLREPAFPALRENAVTYYLAIIATVLALTLIATPSSSESMMLGCAAVAAIILPWASARNAVYVCVATALPIIALLVQRSELAGYMLAIFGIPALLSLVREAFRAPKVERERMFVVLILMFFIMLFWAFFEQAGSSITNFTDRNVDRVFRDQPVTEAEVGKTITFRLLQNNDDSEIQALPMLTQEQLGRPCSDELLARVQRIKDRLKAEKDREKKQAKEDDGEYGPRLADAIEELVEEMKKDDAEKPTDRSLVSISVPPASVSEDGPQSLVFTFTRTGETTEPLRVSFDVSGTAEFLKEERKPSEDAETPAEEKENHRHEKRTDYRPIGAAVFRPDSGVVVIPAGAPSATITIDPEEDTSMEEDETVKLTVVSGVGYAPGDSNEGEGEIENDDKFFTLTHLTVLRDEAKNVDAIPEDKVVQWTVTQGDVGMGVGGGEIPASEFQVINPSYILIFGLIFSALWSLLNALKLEPSTPLKFSLGLVQLGLGFGVFWWGTHCADDRGIVALHWLLLGYLLHTTGELCLSPVGLSMVTKLSPTRMVSTVMGAWFLVTGFSNYLAGLIAMATGVSHGAEGEQVIPPPTETVHLYGDVFGKIALTAIASGVLCFCLVPLLCRWMHSDAPFGEEEPTQTEKSSDT